MSILLGPKNRGMTVPTVGGRYFLKKLMPAFYFHFMRTLAFLNCRFEIKSVSKFVDDWSVKIENN